MAEVLEKFPGRENRRNSKYPWDEWTDGQIRKAIKGEDFETTAADFRSMLHAAGGRYGMKVKTRTPHDQESISFQFYKGEDDGS